MKKFSLLLLALVLVSSQAFAFTVTKTLEERLNDAATGESYIRVTGTLALDSSHPAEGESVRPTQLGMASFTKFTVGPQGPAAWPTQSAVATTDVLRRFAFDYTTNKVYVTTMTFVGVSGVLEVSGPITYDLDYLTSVPFEAVGPIS